jgi:tetratricopeptide (TPR) repeat protein
MKAGDTPRALAYYRVFAEVDSTGVDGWLVLGDTYIALGHLDAAAASYEEVVRRRPGVAVGYARLANLYYFRMGRADLASKVLDAALAKTPAAEFFMVRSQIAAAEQRYPEAEQDVRQALALEPGNGTYLLWLGDLFQTQKRYDEAVAQYTRAVEQSTNQSVAWLAPLRAGRALTDAGRLDAAVDAFETAVAASAAQKQPAASVAAHYVLLGEACVRADRTARARSAFTQALTLDPSNESAAKHLAALTAR